MLPWLLSIGGTIALMASVILTVEKISALQNPGSSAVCDLNPIFSCSSVAASAQAEVFGIPNPIFGIVGYAAIAAVGVALLAGARFKRWFWVALNVGLLLATIFLHWLIFQTLYRIGALCLFCMVVWAVSVPVFWYTFLHSLSEEHIKPGPGLAIAASFIRKHHGDILIVWFLIITGLIGKRFWYYWSSLF